VFSDVVGNTQYRVLWDDRRVTPFRRPSNNSNGNSFDFQGRQLSTEDFNRRVVRWEHDGTMTVIADSFDGKPLNSPNDLVPHPDGSIWFTDPPYGDQLAEGHPDEPGGSANPQGLLNPRVGAPNAGVQSPGRTRGERNSIATAIGIPHALTMFVLTEAQATAIRAAYEQRGEFSAAIELRQLFLASRTTRRRGNACGRSPAGGLCPSAAPHQIASRQHQRAQQRLTAGPTAGDDPSNCAAAGP
jgi:hypothetical protein